MSQSDTKKMANDQKIYHISPSDLPLSCPTKEMSTWNSHPKVYLELKNGKATCPYCGAQYVLDAQ